MAGNPTTTSSADSPTVLTSFSSTHPWNNSSAVPGPAASPQARLYCFYSPGRKAAYPPTGRRAQPPPHHIGSLPLLFFPLARTDSPPRAKNSKHSKRYVRSQLVRAPARAQHPPTRHNHQAFPLPHTIPLHAPPWSTRTQQFIRERHSLPPVGQKGRWHPCLVSAEAPRYACHSAHYPCNASASPPIIASPHIHESELVPR